MGRSRREVYIDILKAFSYLGPLKLTRIMYEAHMNYSVLQEHLGFLTKQNLVKERTAGKKRAVYVLTNKSGRSVVEIFREKYPFRMNIIITAHATVETAIDAVNLAANAYVLKPIISEN